MYNYIVPHSKELAYNIRVDAMHLPVSGPRMPHAKDELDALPRNSLTGHVEAFHMNDFQFEEQYHTFQSFGYAHDPDAGNLIGGKTDNARANETVYNTQRKAKKRKTALMGDAAENPLGYNGPWISAYVEEEEAQKKELDALKPSEPRMSADERRKKEAQAKQDRIKQDREAIEATTVFHGRDFRDYLGRTYIECPTEIKPYEDPLTQAHCYLPKKRIHTWAGHTKGVSAIRFFPTTGHLLLSAGLDNQIKIWDVNNDRRCLRTFSGHSKAVRDICFSNDGRRFLSSGYDRFTRLWDTETGECIGTYSNGKLPYCVKMYPVDQNDFLVGCSDKKIIQWDIRSGNITQEYDQHLGAVNTVTFLDDNRRFVSSSDDKSLRVWEYGIPVVIKYISEPHMHSMPAVTLHPNGKYFLAQSLDNQILCYSARDRFKLNKKKRFAGHMIAGYACQISFSPDGKYVTSGDSEGRMWFWDWKSSKVFKTMKCHNAVSIGCEWHPIDASRVATCGWDGAIHYWD
eukprot:TRINITY_DN7992_c0_g1_i1.p1 TRINITY_DN7992_c0_g1~~TRINITY_DN7992_c0_g1_i1.p1  ORF type:complete len:581 (+),score=197.62 TRINITY_DN7992_c0_g1_i1:204-1745(+)